MNPAIHSGVGVKSHTALCVEGSSPSDSFLKEKKLKTETRNLKHLPFTT